MVTLGPFVFNRWTMKEIRIVSLRCFCLFAVCIIEICVTNASGKADWLSRRGCSARLFSPYFLYLPVFFTFSLYFVKALPFQKWKVQEGARDVTHIPFLLHTYDL